MPRSPEMPMPPLEEMPPEKKQVSPAMEYGELNPEEQKKLEIINEQFDHPKFVEIEAPGVEGKKLKVEYVVLDARSQDDLTHAKEMNDRTVIHIPGFGSSYRANGHYEKLLALKEKKRVIVISQPSTGHSDDAPDEWRKWSKKDRSFDPISEVISNAIDAIRKQESENGEPMTTSELSVSSSSLGSMYAIDLAIKHPEKVKDLVLMHPAGVNEELPTSLGRRWLRETVMGKGGVKAVAKNMLPKKWIPDWLISKDTGIKDLDPDYVTELQSAYEEMFGKPLQQAYEEAGGTGTFDLNEAERQDQNFRRAVVESIIADGTIARKRKEGAKWRAWEAFTIAKGGILKKLPQVKANTYVIYGSKDNLFPVSQLERVKNALIKAKTVMTDIFATHHDDIYQDARKYTASVGGFFDKMREKEKQVTEKK
ncbi:MAG: hypothetical protein WCT27_02500 [Patescibacteria group bacterium]|jgi:pimeloyl-ACP methyl ester carboxylesterase